MRYSRLCKLLTSQVVEIPIERALDIDTELDFEIAEFLMDRVLKSNKDEVNVK